MKTTQFSLPQRAIEELQAAYRADFGQDLNAEAALELADRLLTLAHLINRPVQREELLLFFEHQQQFRERMGPLTHPREANSDIHV